MLGCRVGEGDVLGVFADGLEVLTVQTLMLGGSFVEGLLKIGGKSGERADVFDDCVVVFCEGYGFLCGGVEVFECEDEE